MVSRIKIFKKIINLYYIFHNKMVAANPRTANKEALLDYPVQAVHALLIQA